MSNGTFRLKIAIESVRLTHTLLNASEISYSVRQCRIKVRDKITLNHCLGEGKAMNMLVNKITLGEGI